MRAVVLEKNEAQFYTPQIVNVGGCYLTITARNQYWKKHKYTSGKLESKYGFTYGIFFNESKNTTRKRNVACPLDRQW